MDNVYTSVRQRQKVLRKLINPSIKNKNNQSNVTIDVFSEQVTSLFRRNPRTKQVIMVYYPMVVQ